MNDLETPVTERDHVRGPADADVTLVEYGDFACPFCVRAYPLVRELERKFPSLRMIFRHNPISPHPNGRLASQAAEAAALQNSFWPMHDALFERNGSLEQPALVAIAQRLKLDLPRFERDLFDAGVRKRIHDDEVGAVHGRIITTPTFFVNGARYEDRLDLSILTRSIEVASM